MPRTKKIVAAPVTTNSASIPPTPLNAKAAYAAVVEDVEAVTEEDTLHITVDIAQAAILALGALSAIRPYRAELALLHKFDMRAFDQLENYTLAAFYAHSQAVPSTASQKQVRALIDEGTPLRAILLSNAEMLVQYGVFEAQAVAAIRAGQGHADLAQDLVAFGGMFDKVWSKIAGRTFVTEAQIARATVLGSELLSALGIRSARKGAEKDGSAGDNRVKAYTLFAKAYDEVRRGIGYLRWYEDDVDAIAPSIFSARSSARSTSEKAPANGQTVEGGNGMVPGASAPAPGASEVALPS